MKPATRDAMTEQPCHDTLPWLISFSLGGNTTRKGGEIKMRKITKQERRLRITAYHEAGPAMAMFLYGFRIASVSIVPDEGTLGLAAR
jgi:hypothetical protein